MLERHRPRLRSIARRYCRTADDCEDLIQDTLIRAVRAQHTLSQDMSLNWLRKIMRNLAFDRVRAKTRRPNTVLFDDVVVHGDDISVSLIDVIADPETEGLNPPDVYYKAVKALSQLSEENKAIVLYASQGLTMQEIGDMVGIAPGTVRSRLHRIRKDCCDLAGIAHAA